MPVDEIYRSLTFRWFARAWLYIGHQDDSPSNCRHGGMLTYYTPRFNEVGGIPVFHLVRLFVCGQNRVRSVSSTILIGSISYLHILSSNFRRCVTCNDCFKIQKFKILANSLNLCFWLYLLLTWGGGGGGVYPQSAGVLVVLVETEPVWDEAFRGCFEGTFPKTLLRFCVIWENKHVILHNWSLPIL